MDPESTPAPLPIRICSQSKCQSLAAPDFKTCNRCREKNTRATQARREKRVLEKETENVRKRARPDEPPASSHQQEEGPDSGDETEENQNVRTQWFYAWKKG
ncbi:hypothetical protein B0H10DRAFT_1950636 [Mycena sp. CBHHK59/15]|nr:hypothetical protein B0H10DRAFT_1965337 [Mycena sp. CBHHK59/15]KAJ6601516.1 hypothetical protein B0H10DRAFT_1958446 [Mycena sp. CBHHK59/15]KAJ6614507.1 hypothetical protein B0H10DRAFT_1950636 [Mycena sp. CBHHK59/15]